MNFRNVAARVSRSFIIPLAMLVAALIVGINEYNYWQSREAKEATEAAQAKRAGILTLLQHALDAETGQRGYILTGDVAYLEPYDKAVTAVGASIAEIRALYINSPGQLDTFAELTRSIMRKLTELDMTIRLRKTSGDSTAWQELLRTGAGREYMQSVRAAAETLVNGATEERNAAMVRIDASLKFSRISVAVAVVLCLLAFFVYVNQSTRLRQAAEDQRNALRRERDRLESLVEDRTSSLAELATHLQNVQESERERLARELHDELGSLLTAAKLDVARAKSKLGSGSGDVLERLAHLTTTLNAGIALKRRIIEDLRPSTLSKLGLVPALEILLREFGERTSVTVVSNLEPVALPADHELTIYRVVQEALTNTAKYANANGVTVTLHQYERHVELTVSDNGVGFDVTARSTVSHGLVGMRHRVHALHGTLTVESAIGSGTRISANVPRIAINSDATVVQA